MKEISGCSIIAIGRTEHKYSHLDKSLTLTVPTVRASDNIHYVEQSNIIIGDITVFTSKNDETILSLHKSCQEQEEEIV